MCLSDQTGPQMFGEQSLQSPWSGPWELNAGPHLGCPHGQPRRGQCRLWGRAEHVSYVSCPRHPDSHGMAPPTQTVATVPLSCLFPEILLQDFCNFLLKHFCDSCFKTLVKESQHLSHSCNDTVIVFPHCSWGFPGSWYDQ